MSNTLRIFVVVATVGRAEVTRRTVDRLSSQTRKPDGVVIVGAQESDIEGVEQARGNPELYLSDRGSCNQRNRGLEIVIDRADLVIFFDDDYVAAEDFLEMAERLFAERPNLVGATGRLIADGIHSLGFTVDEGIAMVEADVAPPQVEQVSRALYGCNMVVRVSALNGLRFDPALPLYGWQEDIDFTYQLAQRGEMVKSGSLRGVHLGSRGGRSPGTRLGYSQIANPIYLLRKRTIPPALARSIMWRNVAANLARSLNPEPHIDRRGRAKGNLLALKDLALGRLDPRRILDLP